MRASYFLILLLAINACSKGAKKERIAIISAEPASSAILEKRTIVDFKIKVEHNLVSTDTGKISLVIQDQDGKPLSNLIISKRIHPGKGESTLNQSIWIPNQVSRIDLFTPLYPEGVTQTIIVDYLSYEVASRPGSDALQWPQNVRALLFPDLEISPFLPTQKETDNAAIHYIQALDYYTQDKEAITAGKNFKQLSQRPLMVKAMAKVFDGARYKQCDFRIKYPPPADLIARPDLDLYAFQNLARIMACSLTQYVAKQDFDTAKQIARSIVALGSHLRRSSYFSAQASFGMWIEKFGIQQSLDIAQATNNHDDEEMASRLLTNATKIESMCKAKLSLVKKDYPFRDPLPSIPASARELLINLEDAEPIFRIEGLQIIGTLYNTKYDDDPTLELAKDPNFVAFKNSRPKDLLVIRAKVSELAASDPDSRVREVAKLVLDVLDKFGNKSQP